MMIFLAIALIILLILILISNGITIENGRKRAGNRGEAIIINQLKQMFNNRDWVLTNVKVIYDQKKTELDCVIINGNGVFIIEVKNFRGQLYGREGDNLWQKCKVSRGGNLYDDIVRNPVGQVKRHIYVLSNYLKYYGINVWVEGYVIFVNNKAPCTSKYILNDLEELELILHDKMRKQLNSKQVNQIYDWLNS